jgi:hypothetical protein
VQDAGAHRPIPDLAVHALSTYDAPTQSLPNRLLSNSIRSDPQRGAETLRDRMDRMTVLDGPHNL